MKVENSKPESGTPENASFAYQSTPTKPEDVSKEDQQAFIARFKALDTNNSGVLEKPEYDKAAVSKSLSYDQARQLVTKDQYLTQSDFVVARAQYEHAKQGGAAAATEAPAPTKIQSMTSDGMSGTHHDHHDHHDHGHHDEPQAGGSREGDIKVFSPNASGHIMGASHGRTLNTKELDSIGKTLGLPAASDLVKSLDANKAYNPKQTNEQKLAGAYLALSTAAKFTTMPPSTFSDQKTAAITYGALKTTAMKGDADGVREILKTNGGDPGKLSDEQLTNLWSGNEHQNLHGVLFGNSKIYNPIHATSLNDKDKTGSGVLMGGFNDRGEHPQWGWFQDAQSFNQRVLGKD